METVKIHKHESQRLKPEKTIKIELSRLDIAQDLMPTDIKAILKREGIDISRLGDLSGKKIGKGVLIEVETARDKIVIEIE